MYPANISQVVFLCLCVLYIQLEKMANLNHVKLSIVLILMILLLSPTDAKDGGGFGGGRSKSKIKFHLMTATRTPRRSIQTLQPQMRAMPIHSLNCRAPQQSLLYPLHFWVWSKFSIWKMRLLLFISHCQPPQFYNPN